MRVVNLGLLVCALALAAAGAAPGAAPDAVKIQARAEFSSMSEWQRFVSEPDLDIMKSKPGVGVTFVTDAEELAELRSQGYRIAVEIEDMERHYASRIRGPNFGQFHTYSETEDFLDALHAAYPSITTARDSIGTTIEGRAIWAFKISDNPDIDESEPEVLFDGMHHAREPMSLEVQLHFMNWLTENYGTDPEATFLVDNREIWFIPIVNPDGYCYNETTYPTGGGMWRKNRRDNSGTCEGVDLNRNYPYQWGGEGSSADPCDETYRGTSAGPSPRSRCTWTSSPRTSSSANISFHSVAGLVLLPWAYTNTHTADDATFRLICNEMAESNGYEVGQAGEVLYNCSGITTDWLYAEHDVWATCIEVSGSGFWPAESEIEGLNAENLWPQVYLTRITGLYVALTDDVLTGGNADGKPDPGETLDLTVSAENQSLLASATNVHHEALDRRRVRPAGRRGVGDRDHRPELDGVERRRPVRFHGRSLDPGRARARAHGHDRGRQLLHGGGSDLARRNACDPLLRQHGKRAQQVVGERRPLGADDVELQLALELVHRQPYRQLHERREHLDPDRELHRPLERGHSEPRVQPSLQDGGGLRLLPRRGIDRRRLDVGSGRAQATPGTTAAGWRRAASLADFCGTANFKLRFRFTSDSYVTDDGWYVDDVTVLGPTPGNARPTAPTLSSPPDGGNVSSTTPALTVANATDADPGDVLTYGFVVYADELCTVVAASASGVAEGSGTTSWQVTPALADGEYWWRAYADDGTERGPLMASGSFTADTSGVPDGGAAALALHPARPNPFAAETTLGFSLPARAEVAFTIHSVDGRLVRTLMTGERRARDRRGQRGTAATSAASASRAGSTSCGWRWTRPCGSPRWSC